jgi:hypothetical protein
MLGTRKIDSEACNCMNFYMLLVEEIEFFSNIHYVIVLHGTSLI